jgi:hypothetical protein
LVLAALKLSVGTGEVAREIIGIKKARLRVKIVFIFICGRLPYLIINVNFYK